MRTLSIDELIATKGEPLGASDWITVTQRDIDTFAEATGDHQWIHVDPVRAADGPFGATIAHGFLSLALLPRLWHMIYEVKDIRMAVNYGLNRVRFPSPVPVDSELRAVCSVVDVVSVAKDTVAVTLSTTVELKNAPKPACVAESVVRYTT